MSIDWEFKDGRLKVSVDGVRLPQYWECNDGIGLALAEFLNRSPALSQALLPRRSLDPTTEPWDDSFPALWSVDGGAGAAL